MRRWLFLLLMVVCCQVAVCAEREILVVVTQVRNAEGNILVMIQTDGNEQSFYGLSEAQRGTVSVVVKGIFDRPFLISVFHDEMVIGGLIWMSREGRLKGLHVKV